MNFRYLIACAGLIGLLAGGVRAEAPSPDQIVAQAVDEVFDLLEANRALYQTDETRLQQDIRKVLLPKIDVLYSGRLVLGRYGRGLEPAKVREFAEALADHLIRNYAVGVLEFQSRDQVEILPLTSDDNERATRVRTRVRLNNGEKAPVDYVFRKVDGRWVLFDVIVEGISYVATFRNQIGEQIRTHGFDQTLARLKSGELALKAGDADSDS